MQMFNTHSCIYSAVRAELGMFCVSSAERKKDSQKKANGFKKVAAEVVASAFLCLECIVC